MAVDFARDYPRCRPYDGAAARLARGGGDAVLIVGVRRPSSARARGGTEPASAVVIGPGAGESAFADAEVVVDTAVAGIHESGTALRMDDVPLPLAAAVDGPPAVAKIIATLAGRIRIEAVAHAAANRR